MRRLGSIRSKSVALTRTTSLGRRARPRQGPTEELLGVVEVVAQVVLFGEEDGARRGEGSTQERPPRAEGAAGVDHDGRRPRLAGAADPRGRR